ncbi:MAG: enoyl-CoA hydratase/isomerase family protein [Elusimicrobia bacterium]|nr:enoyl-CoA hydratase/isomerase family protein [Elusimicrobiota bacterium]
MNGPFDSAKTERVRFKEILYDKKGWTATITINRPHAYNSYSTLALQELVLALQDASWDDGVATVVLTGAGDAAFCTGGDVKEYAQMYTRRPRDYWKYMGLFRGFLEGILNLGKPSIARINGMAVGGGNEVQMACDLAVMAEGAYLQQVGTQVGSVACGGATQWLPIHVGDRRAREMLLLCEKIPAQKALEWGLVNAVVPFSQLDTKVEELAKKLLEKFPECTRYTKEQVNFWKNLSWNQTIGHARDWLALHYTSWEPHEGMKAFVEKRAPEYRLLRERARDGKSSEFPWGPYCLSCAACGAGNLPEEMSFCGICGKKLQKAQTAATADSLFKKSLTHELPNDPNR